jgi:predicted DNA-binding protein YlxM (UPF0122 family)
MNENEIIKKRSQAEAVYRSKWPSRDQDVSDFGAYCVEQWLTGRHPETSYYFLGVDYLRSHAYRTGVRGSSDVLSQPTRISLYSEAGGHVQHGTDSFELGRFVESSALRDRRLSERERICLILYYEWKFDLKEIADLFSVSESRASQMLSQALRTQKKRIEAEVTSENERDRQQKEQRSLSREIQARLETDERAQGIVERIRGTKGTGMAESEIEEICNAKQADFGSFASSSF